MITEQIAMYAAIAIALYLLLIRPPIRTKKAHPSVASKAPTLLCNPNGTDRVTSCPGWKCHKRCQVCEIAGKTFGSRPTYYDCLSKKNKGKCHDPPCWHKRDPPAGSVGGGAGGASS